MGDIKATPQEEFWSSEFGDQYSERNVGSDVVASNLAFFANIFRQIPKIDSVIEYGSNIGLNLMALKLLFPSQSQFAVEINESAAKKLQNSMPNVKVFNTAISNFDSSQLPTGPCDLALIKGVLIHMNPDQLSMVYNNLHQSSHKYILICEYYNPTPDVVKYRGHSDRLFRRDFAGEMLDKFEDLTLVNYGFVYHRDPSFPQDDVSWFLLLKNV